MEKFLKKPGTNQYIVKIRGSERWMKLAPEGESRIDIAEGWHSRVSDPTRGNRVYQLRWETKGTLQAAFEREGFVAVESGGGAGQSVGGIRSSRGPPRLIQDIEIKNYRSVARDLTGDPKAARGRIREHLAGELRQNTRLLAEGKHVRAVHHLNNLIDIYGPLPELQIRRGVAHLGRGNAGEAVKSLRHGTNRPLANRNAFFDEINTRLGRQGLRAAERENLRELWEAGFLEVSERASCTLVFS